ncbi:MULTISPECIES: hypothetical protein [Eikenella]|uniref:hypothetical protein n=1 Tax=Eikenella TaxID=538 RepID=UPI0007DEDFE5|nr:MULTISPECIES: hypothetical protein [Eikenella]OAM40163.1 hypothetical protein A7P99_03010 [Eikenella sp. NML120348]
MALTKLGKNDILFISRGMDFQQLAKFQVAFAACILFTFAPHAGAGHFLFFASPKKRKQKKSDCGHRFGFAKLPSLRTVFRAGSQLAAAPLQTCKPARKTALRSAVPAEGWQAR